MKTKVTFFSFVIAVIFAASMSSCGKTQGADKGLNNEDNMGKVKEMLTKLENNGGSMSKEALKEDVLTLLHHLAPVSRTIMEEYQQVKYDDAKAEQFEQRADFKELQEVMGRLENLQTELPLFLSLMEEDADIREAAIECGIPVSAPTVDVEELEELDTLAYDEE